MLLEFKQKLRKALVKLQAEMKERAVSQNRAHSEYLTFAGIHKGLEAAIFELDECYRKVAQDEEEEEDDSI